MTVDKIQRQIRRKLNHNLLLSPTEMFYINLGLSKLTDTELLNYDLLNRYITILHPEIKESL